ncbi:septal ring lytic transglycosylase RlpA family protein [Bartonella sp. B35(2025)]
MLLNSKVNFISIFKLMFHLTLMVAVSQLLISCSTKQTAHFTTKNSSNKIIDKKIVSLPEKVSNEQNKSKMKNHGRGRAVVGKPYQIKGKWYYPQSDPTYKRIGQASWYGSYFHGRLTANGEIYDMNLLTAAHPTMPLPSYARVTNLENGASLIVRVNDRGPFMKDRIIDLSKQAASVLGYANAGITNVKVEYVAEAPVGHYDGGYLIASYVPGNYTPSSLALLGIPEKKDDSMLEKFNVESREQLVKVSVEKKKLIKDFSIKLPQTGPFLVDKPVLFDRVASINKSNKKIKVN